jgi:hypothetical protein
MLKSARRLALVLLAVLLLGGLAVPAASELWRPTLTGTWYFATGVGPGAAVPAVATFHDDGTVVYSDALTYGGVPLFPVKFTPFLGVWRMTGFGKFGGTSVGLMFDPTTNVIVGLERARSALRFDRDLGHVVGTIYLETAMCTGPFACPDPTDPAVVWTPVGDPVNGFPVTLSRLSRVPAGPLQ